MIYLLLLLSFHSFAGNSVGNGGDVVVCKKDLELLDLFELKAIEKKESIKSDEDFKNIIEARLSLLSKLSKNLSALYEKKLKSFTVEFKSDISLRDIKDAGYTFIPKDCKLKQIAYKSNVIGESHQLFINNDYWKKLTPVNQAALLMHEAIYDHFKFFNQTNSKSARKLVGMIFSNDFENRTHADLKKLFLDARIPLD